MEVTRNNFKEALPLVKKSIEAADFLVIDTEFTGLMSGRDVNAFDSPAEYYRRLLEGASDFLLVQYGLVAFYWDSATNRYMNDAYNFYVFPRGRPGPERVFMCQSSSLEFLASQGFNFNKLLLEGISYLTETEESGLRERLQDKHKSLANTKDSVISIPHENKAQIDDICARVKKFLSESEPESLELGRCNAFIRKLVFQEVHLRFKDSAYVETKVLENKDRVLMVTRLSSSQEGGDREEEKRRKEWEELEEAVGFSRVTRLITESEKLVIGHNMLLDVLHTLSHFYQPLPDEYSAFKEFTHCMFPRLLDTKYMSSLPPFKDKVTSSMLPHLLATLSEEPFSLPEVGSLEDRGYSRAEDKSHEAGYDAYITGLCFLAMHRHLARMRGEQRDGALRVDGDAPILKPFVNKLYLSRTAHHDSPYMNLAGKDPEPSRDHVFHISFPREWTRNDIVQLFSPFGPVFVQFLDEESALVALVRREQARSAVRSLTHAPQRAAAVRTYANYKSTHAKGAGAKQASWLSKERLDAYRKQAQVIAASKPNPPEPARTAMDDGVTSTTSTGFIPLKLERKRTSSASSAEVKPSGRKRTSSGVFVVAKTEAPNGPQPKKPNESAEPRKEKKVSDLVPERRARGQSTESDSSDDDETSKKQKTAVLSGSPSTAKTKPASAFEENENWD